MPEVFAAFVTIFATFVAISDSLEKNYRDMRDLDVHHKAWQALDAVDAF